MWWHQSCSIIRARPGDVRQKTRIDSVPAEKMESIIFDVFGISEDFHDINSKTVTWTYLDSTIRDFYETDHNPDMVNFPDYTMRLGEG